MADYILSCSSTADMCEQWFEDRNVKYLCFHFFLADEEFPDDLGKSMPYKKFYNSMVEGAMTKTSQPNADEYKNYFESFLKEGKDVIHLTLSSGISGAFNSAKIAQSMCEEEYPDRKIYVIDSLAASGGFGLLIDMMADLRDNGMNIDDLAKWAEDNKKKLNHWFFTSDLTYLIRGGRVSKTSGFIGNMLNICPLLNVDFEGKLIARAKIRTKKKVIQATADKIIELAENGKDYDGKIFINHADCYEDAKAVADILEANLPKLNGKVLINYIGTTIGAHTGPGTVACFFYGAERVD
ncbi:MAG: DegV family protein [Lachnospiraceae bacterium]|nr:DegV family protein [Lachnospiraceae bacterium]